jgi:transcriptional regulator with XRE-family HTH domain
MNGEPGIVKKKIGLRMQNTRKELNLSQEEFAAHLGVSNGTVSNIENGSHFPSFRVIYHLSKTFNVNLMFLLFGSGERFCRDQVNPSLTDEFPKEQALFLESFIEDFKQSALFRHSIMAYCKKFRLKYGKLMQKEIKQEQNRQNCNTKENPTEKGGDNE